MENEKLCKAVRAVVGRFEKMFKGTNCCIRTVSVMEFCLDDKVDIRIEYNRIYINEYDSIIFTYDFENSEYSGLDWILVKNKKERS